MTHSCILFGYKLNLLVDCISSLVSQSIRFTYSNHLRVPYLIFFITLISISLTFTCFEHTRTHFNRFQPTFVLPLSVDIRTPLWTVSMASYDNLCLFSCNFVFRFTCGKDEARLVSPKQFVGSGLWTQLNGILFIEIIIFTVQ